MKKVTICLFIMSLLSTSMYAGNLTVNSSPSSGVSISASPTSAAGITNYTKTGLTGAVSLTAPATFSGMNFVKWVDGEGDEYTNRYLQINMAFNWTLTAVYGTPSYSLTVQSSPDTSIPISASPSIAAGSTNYTKTGLTGSVSLTAPETYNGKNFLKWTVVGDDDYYSRFLEIAMIQNWTVIAVYETPTYSLNVQSTPIQGIPISASPSSVADSTNYTRSGLSGGVSLDAPATYNGYNFVKWTVVGDDDYYSTHLAIAMNQNRTIIAVYELQAQPTICLNKSSLSPSCQIGQNAQNDTTFEVWNCGTGTLNYTISDNVDWLQCTPASGSSTTEHDTINVTYTTSGLSAGSYSATITINDPAATNPSETINVTLTVTEQVATISGWISFCNKNGDALDGRKDIIPEEVTIAIWKDEANQTPVHQWPAILLGVYPKLNSGQAAEFQYSIDVTDLNLEANDKYTIGVSAFYGADYKILRFEMPSDLQKSGMNFRLTYEDIRDPEGFRKQCQIGGFYYAYGNEVDSGDREAIERAIQKWRNVGIWAIERQFLYLPAYFGSVIFHRNRSIQEVTAWGLATAPTDYLHNPNVGFWRVDFAKDDVFLNTSELVYDTDGNWEGSSNKWSLEGAALHEIGHVIGLFYGPGGVEGFYPDSLGQQWSVMDYTGNTNWVGWSDAVALRRLTNNCITTTAFCPVDLEITDGFGRIVSKTVNQISGATYTEADLDGDGDLDDQINIPDPDTGGYSIVIIPEPGADPDDPVTLTIEDHGETTILLDEVTVADLPTEPIQIEVDRTAPELTISVDPNILIPVDDRMVPVTVNLSVSDADPNIMAALAGIVSNNVDDVNFVEEANMGEFDTEFLLKASMEEGKSGPKVYTITYAATDSTGNVSYKSIEVKVPSPSNCDFNMDKKVNLYDFAILSEWWLMDCELWDWCSGADIDRSANVGVEDIAILIDHWLKVSESTRYIPLDTINLDGYPYSLTVDSAGDIYVQGTYGAGMDRYVKKLSSNGSLIKEISMGINDLGGLRLDPSNDLLVALHGQDQVVKYTSSLDLISGWGISLHTPTGIAITADNKLIIASNWNNAVYKYEPDGTPDTNWASPFPTDVAIGQTGDIFVTNELQNTVTRYSPSGTGTVITSWGGFNHPTAIAADGHGYLYVVDYMNNCVKKFTENGQLVTQFGTSGSGLGQFNGPTCIAIDTAGVIYVADTYNHRIQRFVLESDIAKVGPTGMAWVSVNDPGFNGQMSKYETTNTQYCQFLNAALAAGQITVYTDNIVYAVSDTSYSRPYYNLAGPGITYDEATNGGAARINYTSSAFAVDPGFENHPVTYVSWCGATAFCDYYGYRLPTNSEWQAVADYDGSFTYGCGTAINNSMANYQGSTHPDGTTAVGSFGAYGYGLCDMAGNVEEFMSTVGQDSYDGGHGGGWEHHSGYCTVSYVTHGSPVNTYEHVGFRACRSLNQDLVGYWEFNETGGNQASDSSVYGNHGTLMNGPVWSGTGELSFDGIDDYVQVPDSGSLTFTNQITISAWVQLMVNDDRFMKIAIQSSNTTSADPWENYSIDLRWKNPRFILSSGAPGSWSGAYDATFSSPLTVGTWYHLAGTYDGNTMILYVNGEPSQSRSVALTIGTNELPLCIGGTLGTYGFGGLIDEVRIYNRALSGQEILGLYEAHNGGNPE